MKEFFSFYRWGLNMKFHMAIYTIALVFFKSLANLYQGQDAVSIWTMLQMLVVSMVLAILEGLIFPESRELTPGELRGRTILWAVKCNILLVGGAWLFHWFDGLPLWGYGILAIGLEGGLAAMWVGIHLAQRKDTHRLNKNLHSFQGEG